MKDYSVKFYPEKRNGRTKNVPVLLSVTYSKQRMFYYTGERCNTDQWDLKLSRLKKNNITPDGQTSTTFNASLDKIKVAVDELFKAYEVAKIIPAPDQLKNDLKASLGKEVKKPEGKGFFERYEQFVKDANLRPNTKKKHGTALNKVKAFKADASFESIDVQFLTDFQNFLYTDKINGGLSKNTVSSILKNLRTFINYANHHGWTVNYPFKSFKIEAEVYGDPIFISIEERDMLYNAKIKNERLARVRDMFVFQCLIGCRVGSLVQLNKSNIIDSCIEYIDGKDP
ncbi:MAG TPA: site-specific integrase, partial [Prolixibacteraceae bacterium]|nr:site-specific integrase [Prolixibacteraceae bacterium]